MLSNKNFLIVDDYTTMRKIIRKNLHEMGFKNVVEAHDGKDAQFQMREHSIDFIVCDWNMPRLNGVELLQNLRSDPKYQKIPFMMVTAEAERKSIEIAIAAGVDQFLIKPFTPATFRSKINRLVQQDKNAYDVTIQNDQSVGLHENKTHPEPSKKMTVLVVDDLPVNIDVVSGILKNEYRVLVATNGRQALKLAQGNLEVDLILLDIMMPEMDGMEVCRLLKENPVTVDIPIIFLTAKVEVDDITAALDAGAVDYVTKPFNPKVLKARVRTHISLKVARDELNERVDILLENSRLREDVELMTRHDIKNPLSAIISNSESLIEGSWLAMDQKNIISDIVVSAYDILRMIDRSLDLYKIETGQYKVRPQSIDIIAIASKVVNAARLKAKTNRITITLEAPEKCFAQGEELLVFSMLGNLIINAVEASDNGGKVTIIINCDKEVVITIQNQNVVPERIQKRFFDKYVTWGKDKGTGLGTYSAKLMAEIQKGEISFDSSQKNGTTLTVKLPK